MMTYWLRELDIVTEWEQAEEGAITPQELARIISSKLNLMKATGNEGVDADLENFVERFKDFSNDPFAEAEDFDKLMWDFYDWADTELPGGSKACWVRTVTF